MDYDYFSLLLSHDLEITKVVVLLSRFKKNKKLTATPVYN